MASLGSLVADLILETAQWTAPLAKSEADLVKFHNEVKKTVDDMTNKITGFVGGFAAGFLSVQAVMQSMKASMDWGHELDLLSAQTGSTVEELDQLAIAAKLNDVSLEQMQQSLGKLTGKMVEATNPNKQASAIFKALGVDVLDASGKMKTSTEVMQEVGVALNSIEDPALRAATATALLGKSGPEMAAKMANFANDMKRSQEVIDTFGATTTAGAKAATAMGDSMTIAGQGVIRFVAPINTALAPALDGIVKAFGDVTKSGTGLGEMLGNVLAFSLRTAASAVVLALGPFQQIFILLKGIGTAAGAKLAGASWAEVGEIFKNTGKEMDTAAAGSVKALQDIWKPTVALGEAAKKTAVDTATLKAQLNGTADEAKKAGEKFAKLTEEVLRSIEAREIGITPATLKAAENLALVYYNGKISVEAYHKELAALVALDPIVAKGAADRAKAEKEVADRLNASNKEYNQLRVSLDEMNDKARNDIQLAQLAGTAHDLLASKLERETKQRAALQKIWDDAKATPEEQARRAAATIALFDAEYKERDATIAAKGAQLEYADALKITTQGISLYSQENSRAMDKQLAALRDEVSLMGLSDEARQREINSRKQAAMMVVAQSEEERKKIANDFAELEAMQSQQRQFAAWSDVFKAADQYGQSFFESFAEGAKGVQDWAAKAGQSIKKWLLDLLYQMTLKPFIVSIVASMGTSMGGNASAISQAAGGMGGAGNMMSTLGTLFGGGGAGAAFGGVEASAAFVGPPTALAGGMTGMMASMAPLMAAAPYVAAAAAIAYTVYNLIKSKEGGPKTEGFAQTGSQVGRFYTGGDRDADISKMVTGINAGFEQTLKGLGGTAAGMGFALGFNQDPKGKAPSSVQAGVYRGGTVVYKSDVQAGRSDEELQAAIALESKRAMLAGLQASDLPDSIAKILDTVAAATATSDSVDSIIALASAFKSLQDVTEAMTDPMKGAVDAIDAANRTALESWGKQRDAFYELADATEPTVEGLSALSSASAGLYQSTVQLLAGMMQLKDQLAGMFGDTREAIVRATMTDDQLYAHIQGQTEDLWKQLQNATDPAEINKLAQQINKNITDAWGMLTPEEQAAKQTDFLNNLDRVDKMASDRLDKVMGDVQTKAQTDQQFLTSKLDDILASITTAGDTFKAGADTVSNATSRGIDVNISVQDDRLVTEVTG